MSRFVTGVADIVKKECRTTMLHNDMYISRFMVYCQSIEESKLRMMTRELKRGRSDEHDPPRFMMRAKYKDSSTDPNVNHERGGGSKF